MFDPFELEFFQRGVVEILLLAVASGLLGTWVVLRGLAFFAHAVGTATFPGLVLADGLGFAAVLGAFGSALIVAGLIGLAGTRRRESRDSVTAIVLAAAFAVGVILASDVFGSQARVDRLLFGSLLAIDGGDQLLAAAVALAAAVGTWLLGPRWLAAGFAGGEGARSDRGSDAVLVLLVAFAAIAALSAVGALLATTLIVLPAATTRLVTQRIASWQAATVALAAAEGVGGLWLSFELNVPPGAGIAVLAGGVFAATAAGRALITHRRVPAPAMLALLGASAFLMVGCGSDGASGGERPIVVATTTQLADIARSIGGPYVDVRELLRAGVDPHSYEPRPDDVEAIANADLVLTSGLGLDDWADDLIDSAGTDAPVLDVGAAVPTKLTADGETDPHWWHDPRNVIAASRLVEPALVRAGADGSRIRLAARGYRTLLQAIDRRSQRCVSRVPASERKIVTDHDAITYFTDRYGIEVVGAIFPAQSTQAQASAGEVAALERVIEAEDVKAVFPDSALNARVAEQIARDTGASAELELYGDSLGPRGSGADTIAGTITRNADALVRGMSGGRVRCGPERP